MKWDRTDIKIIVILTILLLLYLLLTKNKTGASIRLLDPLTHFPVGDTHQGRSAFIVGEALIPPGIPNDKNDSAFQFAAQYGEITCPIGTEIVLDANNGKAYCMSIGSDPNFGAEGSQTP